MLKSVRVPPQFEPPFAQAEQHVEKLFSEFHRRPEQGTLHIGTERYVLMRAESLYLTWFDAMAETFGEDAAKDFIYGTAREIGRSDSNAFSERFGLTEGVERLSAGPVHFAHAGWAFVDIQDDSVPARDDAYFLHYFHPNTFESETAQKRGRKLAHPGCWFSAGYSAGWCSAAFGVEVHGREIQCLAAGGDACEFIMTVRDKLDEGEARAKARWTRS
jgi:predicted hydrocarbon binding protein